MHQFLSILRSRIAIVTVLLVALVAGLVMFSTIHKDTRSEATNWCVVKLVNDPTGPRWVRTCYST